MKHLEVVTVAKAKTRGDILRDEISEAHDLDPTQREMLEEACRIADRLDELDKLVVARGVASALDSGILSESRQQQNVMKQLLVALRLPDAAGKKPTLRAARGAYAPRSGASKDRLKAV